MSEEKTTEQVRNEFLSHVEWLVKYWDDVEKDKTKAMEGLAFSIMAALDGVSMSLPSFIVAPLPHPDDKEYHIEEDEDYYPENHEVEIKGDITGSLHELIFKTR